MSRKKSKKKVTEKKPDKEKIPGYEIEQIPHMPFSEEVAKVTPCYVKKGDELYPVILEYGIHTKRTHFTDFIAKEFDYICIFGEHLKNICTICKKRFDCIAKDVIKPEGCTHFNIITDFKEKGLKQLDGEITEVSLKNRTKHFLEGDLK